MPLLLLLLGVGALVALTASRGSGSSAPGHLSPPAGPPGPPGDAGPPGMPPVGVFPARYQYPPTVAMRYRVLPSDSLDPDTLLRALSKAVTGSAGRHLELVVTNPCLTADPTRPPMAVGQLVTSRPLVLGQTLVIPPSWYPYIDQHMRATGGTVLPAYPPGAPFDPTDPHPNDVCTSVIP